MIDTDAISRRFEAVRPALTERSRRLFAAAETMTAGYGGVTAVSTAPRGDPERPLLWTSKSLRHLSSGLGEMGHQVSPETVAALLRELGYSLQANRKTLEGSDHPDRDAQYEYINTRAKDFQAAGQPVISVDTKKKELVGDFRTAGRAYRPRATPEEVQVHDFLNKELGRAAPYGIHDIAAKIGWVNVGMSSDTASFAVESILIAGTTTSTGLKVHCELDDNVYPKGIVVSDQEMAAIHITRNDLHGDWNYTISPRQTDAIIV